ncbi:hypothetical protein Pcinc_003696 [Petrolisthes cinctipes]|uniref:PiggyBac transposable element-derived protein domain-containing protein n=1 Tax=Petrolisthes cinctipes TaxID=88211 RepID=A0AAE1L1U4_PETCI|nr:hypothetical protein Pcinc_003696 [Petrolisthes cinctipes]
MLTLKSDNEMKQQGRGTFEEWKSCGEGAAVAVVKWYDNKGVTLISSFTGAEPTDEVVKYDKKSRKCVDITRLHIVNLNMGGVDLADFFLSLYRILVRSKKLYHRLIFHMIDMTN